MIRPAQFADIDRIAEIHALASQAAYRQLLAPAILKKVTPSARRKNWMTWFSEGKHEVFVAEDGGSVEGFVRLCAAREVQYPPRGYGELTHLYLHPSRIGSGMGRLLFEFGRERLRRAGYAGMLLWTIEGNSRARRFYEKQGLVHDGAKQDQPDWLGEGVYEVRYVMPFDAQSDTDESMNQL